MICSMISFLFVYDQSYDVVYDLYNLFCDLFCGRLSDLFTTCFMISFVNGKVQWISATKLWVNNSSGQFDILVWRNIFAD